MQYARVTLVCLIFREIVTRAICLVVDLLIVRELAELADQGLPEYSGQWYDFPELAVVDVIHHHSIQA